MALFRKKSGEEAKILSKDALNFILKIRNLMVNEIQEIELWFKKDYQETFIRQFGRSRSFILYLFVMKNGMILYIEANNLLYEDK